MELPSNHWIADSLGHLPFMEMKLANGVRKSVYKELLSKGADVFLF